MFSTKKTFNTLFCEWAQVILCVNRRPHHSVLGTKQPWFAWFQLLQKKCLVYKMLSKRQEMAIFVAKFASFSHQGSCKSRIHRRKQVSMLLLHKHRRLYEILLTYLQEANTIAWQHISNPLLGHKWTTKVWNPKTYFSAGIVCVNNKVSEKKR